MTTGRHLIIAIVLAASLTLGQMAQAADSTEIKGAWRPEEYRLREGIVKKVTGLIFFSEKDWSVLFFIVTDDGPQQASAEGGTYQLEGNRLVFKHLYNFSGGKEVAGKKDTGQTMVARNPSVSEIPSEACTIELKDDLLTIHFPSGNLMTFRRSSGF